MSTSTFAPLSRPVRRPLSAGPAILWRALVVILAGLALAACATTDRLPPVPLELAEKSSPLDIPDIRFYADRDDPHIIAIVAKAYQRRKAAYEAEMKHGQETHFEFLAISGGGDDGAFGAGYLAGWTARGDRPQFALVTGVSTGALSAPFAFLGSDYDSGLKSVYTDVDKPDIFEQRAMMAAITNDAMTDTAPLRRLVAHHLDERMIHRIAEEYGKGRLLFVLTTNLDQGRPVVWNIGAIAESRHPRARALIIDILMASAALPGLFPPVMIDITIGGKRYQEMHVDGGTISQAFLYPSAYSPRRAAKWLKIPIEHVMKKTRRSAYIIRNGRPYRPEADVKRQTLSIVSNAVSTMVASSGLNDAYRMYLIAQRDKVDFNLTFIDHDFAEPYTEPFDKSYMRKLYDYGFAKAKAGASWTKSPPGYRID